MDEGNCPFGADHGEREAHPGNQIGFAFDRGFGLAQRRGCNRTAAFVEWRVGDDMVEAAGREPRRRMQQISQHGRDPRFHAVEEHVVTGEPNQVALHLEADYAQLRHPCGETQHRRTRTTADIKHKLTRLGGHRSGKEHRVDRGTITVCRLPEADPATHEPVLGKRRLDCRDRAHLPLSSDAASSAQARR